MKTFRQIIILKASFITIALSILTSSSWATSIYIGPATYSSNTIWDADTVIVTGDLTVPNGIKLSILPGTYVKFAGWYQLIIDGELEAIGADGDSITFTINDTTGFYNIDTCFGGWKGIELNSQSTSRFDKCIFTNIKRYAKESGDYFPGISIKSKKGYFLNSRFTNNITSYGLISSITYNNPQLADTIFIINNRFTNNLGFSNYNQIANVIYISYNNKAIIRNNYFTGNRPYDINWAVYVVSIENSEGNIIDSNQFINNYNGIYVSAASGVFSNNKIIGNKGLVILNTEQNTNMTFINNEIKNNQGGISIGGKQDFIGNNIQNNDLFFFIISNNSRFINNNYIFNKMYIEVRDYSKPVFINNIIWGNGFSDGVQVGIYHMSEPKFYNCLLQNGTNGIRTAPNVIFPSVFKDIKSESPSFIDSANNLTLNDTSICINNGMPLDISIHYDVDIYGNKRVSNGNIDIGAVEKHFSNLNICSDITADELWIADTVKVNCDINVKAKLKIAPGTLIMIANNKGIKVNEGSIEAIGNEKFPIVFTSQDTSGFYKSNDEGTWKGIAIINPTDTNELSFTRIEFAVNALDILSVPDLFLNNSIITNCKSSDYYSSIISIRYSRAKIKNTLFYNNLGRTYINVANVSFEQCRIFNNYNFQIIEANNIRFSNTIFANNGGITFSLSDILMTNCLFSNNAGIDFTLSNPIIYNTIFNQKINLDISGTMSQPRFVNCLFNNNEKMPGSNNIYEISPQFYQETEGSGFLFDALSANWSLKANSLCINRGSTDIPEFAIPEFDIANNPRIVGSDIDIGPYEHQTGKMELTQQPVNFAKCENDSAVFVVQANDTAFYQWQKDTLNIPGATNNILKIGNISSINEGNYNCIVTNGYGTITSNNAYLFVKSAPEILSSPESRFVSAESQFATDIPVTGNKPITYTWYTNGTINSSFSAPTLEFSSFNISDEGNYKLLASNECGTDSTDIFSLSILPETKIEGNDSIICTGDTVVLRTIAGSTASRQWRKNGKDIAGATGEYLTFDAIQTDHAGSFNCMVTSAYGNRITEAVYIAVSEAPEILMQPQSQWTGIGESFTSEVSSVGSKPLSYQWYKNDSLITGEDDPRFIIAGFQSKDEGIFTCVVSNSCGTDTSQKAACYISPQITIVSGNASSIICEGDSFEMLVNNSFPATYQWQKDGQNIPGMNSFVLKISSITENSAGNYYCKVNTEYKSANTAAILLQVRTEPYITDEPSSTLMSANYPLSLDVKAEGQRPISYQWQINGVSIKGKNVIGDTTMHLRIDSFNLENEGSYICRVTNMCGSVYSSPAIINLAPEICMVTVTTDANDPVGHNTIIWEKHSKVNYKLYNIYRQTSTEGSYLYLGSASGNDVSQFDDTLVDPARMAYYYKITATDQNNNETDINLCKPHKNIHLMVTQQYGKPNVQLQWDEYIGFEYKTYYIYRSSDDITGFGGLPYDSIASTNLAWTDVNVVPAIASSDPVYYYFVSVKKEVGCDSRVNTRKKAGGGLFSQAESNMEDNRLQSSFGDNINESNNNSFELSCSPNPFTCNTELSYKLTECNNIHIEVYDLIGQEALKLIDARQLPGKFKYTISGSQLNKGIYVIKLSAGNSSVTTKLVKE
jgi:parallel beta-helix repeat protein